LNIHFNPYFWLTLASQNLPVQPKKRNMKAYYKQGWGISYIVLGAVLLVLNFMLINMGKNNPMGLVLGSLLILIGILNLLRPVFELRANELVLFNLLGMEVKRYAFNHISDFQVIDGKVFIASGGKSKRVRISKMMVKTSDWQLFLHKITSDDMTRELHNI